LKILTWNCNGAFRKKFESVSDFDVIVVSDLKELGIESIYHYLHGEQHGKETISKVNDRLF